jgi:hypothetical protein
MIKDSLEGNRNNVYIRDLVGNTLLILILDHNSLILDILDRNNISIPFNVNSDFNIEKWLIPDNIFRPLFASPIGNTINILYMSLAGDVSIRTPTSLLDNIQITSSFNTGIFDVFLDNIILASVDINILGLTDQIIGFMSSKRARIFIIMVYDFNTNVANYYNKNLNLITQNGGGFAFSYDGDMITFSNQLFDVFTTPALPFTI